MCINIWTFRGFFAVFRCYLLDDSGMLTFDPQFVASNDRERHLYEGVSLAHRDGFIFSNLVKKGLFIKHSRIDYQGVCTITPQVPQVPDLHFYAIRVSLKKKRRNQWIRFICHYYNYQPSDSEWRCRNEVDFVHALSTPGTNTDIPEPVRLHPGGRVLLSQPHVSQVARRGHVRQLDEQSLWEGQLFYNSCSTYKLIFTRSWGLSQHKWSV